MQTLALDQSYQPIGILPWQRAITLLFLGKVEVVEEYDEHIKHTVVVMRIPAVVRFLERFRRPRKPVKFSRVNIYGRDDHRCQYCGEKCSISELTYDHVVPRAQGGKTEWTNIVSACSDCNGKKGCRTPAQAKMRLRKEPVQPTAPAVVTMRVSSKNCPDAWRDYLYWTGELDQT